MSEEIKRIADQLSVEIKEAGVSRAKVLSEAGVSRATFWRWSEGISSPRKASITAIRDAIQRLSVEVAEADV